MDVKPGGFSFPLGTVQLLFLIIILLPFGNVNATSGIARQVSSFCAPAMTTPDVGSCSACHTTSNESRNDLNAAGMQSGNGNFAFFCPASTPTSTPTPTPAPTPDTGTGTGGASTGAMGSGMTGMRGSRGNRGSRRGMGRNSHRHRHHHDDDDDDRDDD